MSYQSVCVRDLHEDLEQLKNTNAALRRENDTLREQLNTNTPHGNMHYLSDTHSLVRVCDVSVKRLCPDCRCGVCSRAQRKPEVQL